MGEERRLLSEAEIEQHMSQLPYIKDKQSKSEMYEQIQMKIKERQMPKKAYKKRWIPLVTAVAAILLFIVVAPSLFNQGEQKSEQLEEAFDLSVFNSESDDESSMNGFARSKELAEVEAVEDEMRMESVGQMITVPYTDENGEFIIPLSFQISETENKVERMEYYLNQDSSQFLTSSSSAIFQGLKVKEENGELILDIPEGKFAGGTAGATLFLEGTQVILDSLGYEKVKLQSNGHPSVSIEQQGEVSELKNERQTGGYFRYRTKDRERVLVPGELSYFNRVHIEERSFEKVLHEMEFPQEVGTIESPFPSGVSLEKLNIEVNEVFITLKGSQNLKNNEESQLFIEAILLTAKQFDIDFVTFLGTEVKQVGPYPLSERLQTDIAPNMMKPSS